MNLSAIAFTPIRGSILPSSDPSILRPIKGKHGVLQVRQLVERQTHGLFFNDRLLVTKHNGYSCHALAERIVSAWDGKTTADHAMEQVDYILQCGGDVEGDETLDSIRRVALGQVSI